MLDAFDLPTSGDIQIFQANSNVATTPVIGYQTWKKPRGCKMVYFLLVGGGGGGGGGHSAAAGNKKGGGGGGSSGVITRACIPAFMVPDTLFAIVGEGGAGGAAMTDGSFGGTTALVMSPRTGSATEAFLQASRGAIGAKGTNSVGGAGGTAASAVAESLMSPASLTMYQSIGGRNGASGGAAVSGTDAAFANTVITGGAGGGGCSSLNAEGAGGSQTGAPDFLQNCVGGAAGGTNSGPSGSTVWKPFSSQGGCGGGGFATGAGGDGGDGGIGSGGGGGGAGTTGGRGGNGGPGIIFIVCF